MRRMFLVLASALLLGAVVLVGGCGGSTGATAAAGGSTGAAPAFSGARFDGSQVSLESFRGKPLVLIFWASW
jgi:cytochrome oxidase Cu insertion factor (SCO1/SenC/PrrC family)